MKTTTSYNFAEIVNAVLSGKVNTLYVIISRTYDDDKEYFCDLKWHNEPYFAGTTLQEAQDAMNAASAEAAEDVEEYQRITLLANKITVSPADFADLDEDFDDADAEMAIEEIVDAHKEGADDVPEAYGEWDSMDVFPEYESMEDAILVYYSWEPYVGYARKLIRLEYCLEDKTTLSCAPTDKAFSVECERLVSPAEVQNCKNASELRELMNERLRSMGKWKHDTGNHYKVIDAFLEDCYNNDSYHIYQLPENDYYNGDDNDDDNDND